MCIRDRDVIELLEMLNNCFQGSNRTVAGLYKSVEHITDGLNALKTNKKCSLLFTECNDKIFDLGLEVLKHPKLKKVPTRIGGTTDIHVYCQSCEEYYRQVVDTAVGGLQNRILKQIGVKKQLSLSIN